MAPSVLSGAHAGAGQRSVVNRWLLIAIAAIGVIAISATAYLVLFSQDFMPYRPGEKLIQIGTDGIWIATGLVAWRHRPDNPVGRLMVALGFAELAHNFFWGAPLPFTVAELVAFWTLPIAVALFVSFPSGRLGTRFERWFVGSTAVAVIVLSVLSQLNWDPADDGCPQCPRNLLLVVRNRTLWTINSMVGDVFLITILSTVAVLLVRHLRRASGPTRYALRPVLFAAAAAAFSLGVVIVADALGFGTEGSPLLIVGDMAYAAIPVAFLVGLLRTRLHRSAVADLVVELNSLPPPGNVRDAIAGALGDPSLEVAFWLPDEQRYIDANGAAVELDLPPRRAVSYLDRNGRRVAALVHDTGVDDDPELLDAVRAAATLALDNLRLQAELRAQLGEVRASRVRILEAGDAERRRIERDLHDGAQQRLLGIRLALQVARGRLNGAGPDVDDLLVEADADVVGALEDLRSLARGLHPVILSDSGLGAALASLARRSSLPVELSVCDERLPAAVEAAAYFVSAEALANVAKHAHASRAVVSVTRAGRCIEVAVCDDGIGGANVSGAGLRGLRDRVETLDGHLAVVSPPGDGTRVIAAIPCE
jgi:signal transduction histidine kinase